jgi:hypothetical protein
VNYKTFVVQKVTYKIFTGPADLYPAFLQDSHAEVIGETAPARRKIFSGRPSDYQQTASVINCNAHQPTEPHMTKSKTIEAAMLELARREGIEMNGQDKLVMRTQIAQNAAAKKRYRDRMTTGPFEWKRPATPRR